MLHNSANVMMRQSEEENIPDYPLFTHDEIDRCAKRLTGLPFGHAKHFRGAQRRHRDHLPSRRPRGRRRRRRDSPQASRHLLHRRRALREPAHPRRREVSRRSFRHADHRDHPRHHRTPDRQGARQRDRAPDQLDQRHDPARRLLPHPGVRARPHAGDPFRSCTTRGNSAGWWNVPIYAAGLGMDLADYFDEIARKTEARAVQSRDHQGTQGEADPAQAEPPARIRSRTRSTSSAPA